MTVFTTFRVPVDVVGRSRRRRLTRRVLLADLRASAAEGAEPGEAFTRDEAVREALAAARARRSAAKSVLPRWY